MSRFDKSLIPKEESNVYSRINLIDKLLTINGKYSKTEDVPTFKKAAILKIFKELEYKVNYIKGGAYVIDTKYGNYKFQLSFVIRYNSPIEYVYIYKDEELIGPKVTNLSFLLNYYDYDESLINPNFGLNSLKDLKKYITDMIDLFHEFVKAYIEEVNIQSSSN